MVSRPSSGFDVRRRTSSSKILKCRKFSGFALVDSKYSSRGGKCRRDGEKEGMKARRIVFILARNRDIPQEVVISNWKRGEGFKGIGDINQMVLLSVVVN